MGWLISEYVTTDGKNPFRTWLATLDVAGYERVPARLRRFTLGNLGDHKPVGGGVWEARLPFGPGYRIYFSKVDRSMVLLLLGGDKSFQRDDIREAQRLWRDYHERLT